MVPTSTSSRPALAQDVGDAEAVADLDQLAAGDEHLAAARRGGEGEQHCGGVVVDGERVLGAGDRAQHIVDVVLARGAVAARQAVLEVGVAGGGGDDGVDRRLRQQRPAEVGVHDDTGRVDHAPERRRHRRLEQARDPRGEGGRREVRRLRGGRLAARQDLRAKPVEDRAGGVDHQRARVAREESFHSRLTQHLVDPRQRAQPLLAGVARRALLAPGFAHSPTSRTRAAPSASGRRRRSSRTLPRRTRTTSRAPRSRAPPARQPAHGRGPRGRRRRAPRPPA